MESHNKKLFAEELVSDATAWIILGKPPGNSQAPLLSLEGISQGKTEAQPPKDQLSTVTFPTVHSFFIQDLAGGLHCLPLFLSAVGPGFPKTKS